MNTVIKPKITPTLTSNNYDPIISSNSVIESKGGKVLSLKQEYLKVSKYLGEFETKESKELARKNLGITKTNLSTDVIFSDNLTITTDVGVHKVDSTGNKVLEIKGMNLLQVMQYLYSEAQNPEIELPYVSLSSLDMGSKEVGTTITPRYTASLNPGSYLYGPDTEVSVISWKVTDSNGGTSTSNVGNFESFKVIDNTTYTITATVTHSEGAIPINNLGQPYPAGLIESGTKSKTLGTISGHRKSFYGTVTNKELSVDSNLIRNLQGKSANALTNGSRFDISIPINAIRVIIAYPASLRQLTLVLDVNGFNAPIESEFIKNKTIILVKGANDYLAIDYQVYYMDYASPNDKVNTYKILI